MAKRTGHVGDGLVPEDLQLGLDEGLPVDLVSAQHVDQLLGLRRGNDQGEQICRYPTTQ